MRKFLTLFTVLLFSGVLVFAQSRTVSGKITDDQGIPLPDVSVLVKGTKIGTITKSDGTYTLTVPSNGRTLVFSSVNMESKEVPINNQSEVNTSLITTANALSEVVVVGYQTVKKSDLTGSVANIGSEKLAQKPIGNFTQLLQGQAPMLTSV